MSLRSDDNDLRDLASSRPVLHDAVTEAPTGIRLVRWLGMGGTAVVFLAELDSALSPSSAVAGGALSPLTPRRLCIKFIRPSIERQLDSINLKLLDLAERETAALARVMSREPPTEFIISLYGSGTTDVAIKRGAPRRLPWLALEFIDGGSAGSTLSSRVERAVEGIDPLRALRLIRGLTQGVQVFHELDILHRDIKPDNVFVSGPVDDETPKIADCGVARVEGLAGGVTLPGMTPEYGGPEQILSVVRPGERNPLVGPWTDVHALAATVWFILGGEPWCFSMSEWDAGRRRSLRLADGLHRGVMEDEALIDAFDRVLARGASHKLPDEAWRREGAAEYERAARARFSRSMFGEGPARYATVAEFVADLMPLVEKSAARWTARAMRENRPAMTVRPTMSVTVPPGSVTEHAPPQTFELPRLRAPSGPPLTPVEPENVAFLPGYGSFMRFGERLLYLADAGNRSIVLPVPALYDRLVTSSRWLVRGPAMGIALVGPEHVLLIRRGQYERMPLPVRAGGGEVGPIEAVIGDGRVFGVVTAETDDSNGGPELWRSQDGAGWSEPLILPLGGEVRALAAGPFGTLVVGARRGQRARALFLGLDDQAQVFTTGVNDKGPLFAAVAGATRQAWAAGEGFILRFEAGGAAVEKVALTERPLAMGLDLVGIPWLVTARAVLRRHERGGEAEWRVMFAREPGEAAFVAIGFSAEGARVLDAMGGGVRIAPSDIDEWQ